MDKSQRRFLVGLIAPFIFTVLNLSMFRVAIPAIRTAFNLPADSTAWLVTAYSLAYMIFMPLYGWLGDRISKRWIFIAGIGIYTGGTLCILFSSSMALILVGRVIQAIGVSGISPLCIAAIADRFPQAERGSALAKWNSTGAFAAVIGPFIAGFLVDNYYWRAIYWPVLFVGAVAVLIVLRLIPSALPVQLLRESDHTTAQPPRKLRHISRYILRNFDWVGALLFGLFLAFFVFYLSSRPITGRNPLTDWRLGIGAIMSLALLVVWEKRNANPIIPIDLFKFGDFIPATVCSTMRMFILGGVNLLIPLYMAEIHGLSASWIGSALAAGYVFHFISMRIGGTLADRWGSKRLIIPGLCIQGAVCILLGLLGASVSHFMLIPIFMLNGIGSGSYLAPLHRAAMAQVPKERTGAGAGFYSSIRFGGVLLGPTIAGVLLENGLMRYADPLQAYQRAFLLILIAVAVGIVVAVRIKN